MSAKAESEARLLSAAELEIVNITREPGIPFAKLTSSKSFCWLLGCP